MQYMIMKTLSILPNIPKYAKLVEPQCAQTCVQTYCGIFTDICCTVDDNYDSFCCASLLTSVFFPFSSDHVNRTAIAVITACFICFAIFIVVLILLKMARLHRRRKKQSLDITTAREEMVMLHYRQKSTRTGNNNDDDMD